MASVVSNVLGTTAGAAHSAAATILAASPIKVGDQLPAVKVKEGGPTETIEIHNVPGKIVIIGLPAAFSPACSNQVPEYIEKYSEFQGKGISGIYVVSVNDAFVMKAWKDNLAKNGTPIHFIADDTGDFVSKLGLVFNAQEVLGGPRAKRFAIVADNGKVTHIAVENNPPDVILTKANTLLAQL